MSPAVYFDKGKDILILGERLTQRLDDNTLTTEEKYPINFIQSGKNERLCTVFRYVSKDYVSINDTNVIIMIQNIFFCLF